MLADGLRARPRTRGAYAGRGVGSGSWLLIYTTPGLTPNGQGWWMERRGLPGEVIVRPAAWRWVIDGLGWTRRE